MNADSSRSHSIFTVHVEMMSVDPVSAEQHIRTAKLHLVDLAGSERQSKTGVCGCTVRTRTKQVPPAIGSKKRLRSICR
jgi:kinesin family protein 3/17